MARCLFLSGDRSSMSIIEEYVELDESIVVHVEANSVASQTKSKVELCCAGSQLARSGRPVKRKVY
jgi:hypothetical protein